MDFTKLEGIDSKQKDKLNHRHKELRRYLYIEFANTSSLSRLFLSVLTQFKEYVKENLLRPDCNGDVLCSFFEGKKCGTAMKKVDRIELVVRELCHPLSPVVNVSRSLKRSHQVTTKSSEIGYQHLYMLSNTSDSSETSDTDSSDSDVWDYEPLKKKIKTCQKALEADCNLMLEYHVKNVTRIAGTAVHVDILIFVDKSVCKRLSEYLGLIYMEDLLTEAEENDTNSVLRRLNNKNAKLYRLLQTYVNKKLITGRNNVCLVHTLQLWESFSANVRGVISNEDDGLFYREPIDTANFCVALGEQPPLIDYVEAVAIIINKALSYETHVSARYQCDEGSFCTVKLPLISIVPLYILRYFTQCKIKERNNGLM